MRNFDLCSLVIMAAVISFLGFVTENLWLCVRKGYIDNRNMYFPFLAGYGVLVEEIYMLIGSPSLMINDNKLGLTPRGCYIVYFLSAAVLVSIGEIILGTAVEKLFGFEYWNYEKIPMHITKYTSVPTSLGFAFIITFFTDKCFMPIMDRINNIDHESARTAAWVLGIVMAGDFIISFGKMYRTGKLNENWRIEVPALYDEFHKPKRNRG